MAYIYDIADTWNAIGTTFTAINMNVTDTSSAAGSLLMDLQVGGASRFSVTKAGGATFAGAVSVSGANNSLSFPTSGTTSAGTGPNIANYFGTLGLFSGSTLGARYQFGVGGGWILPSGQAYSIDGDVNLFRDAANTLAQRNGVNAQAFNLYNTYTDASNYERGVIRWSSNAFEIGTEKAGTGSTRDVRFVLGNALSLSTTSGANNIGYIGATAVGLASGVRVSWTSGTNAGSGTDTGIRRAGAAIVQVDNGQEPASGGAIQFLEQTAPAAPATNAVRIYAEDDGAGKTRLMARFATGAAVQIAIEP